MSERELEEVACIRPGANDAQRPGESGMAFAVRLIQAAAWDEGAAVQRIEDGSELPAVENPYRGGRS